MLVGHNFISSCHNSKKIDCVNFCCQAKVFVFKEYFTSIILIQSWLPLPKYWIVSSTCCVYIQREVLMLSFCTLVSFILTFVFLQTHAFENRIFLTYTFIKINFLEISNMTFVYDDCALSASWILYLAEALCSFNEVLQQM